MKLTDILVGKRVKIVGEDCPEVKGRIHALRCFAALLWAGDCPTPSHWELLDPIDYKPEPHKHVFKCECGEKPDNTKNCSNALTIIDLDADPFVPSGWSVESHQKGGQFIFDPANIQLYLSKKQNGGYVIGTDLHKELCRKPVLNANVLDYLLKPENQHLIPEEWKGKYVFFWGTIYRSSDGDLYVRCLCFDGGGWYWHCRWLGSRWSVDSPEALRAS